MANVNNPDLTGFDDPIELIRVAAGRKDPGFLLTSQTSAFGKLSDPLYRLADSALDVLPHGLRSSMY
jgi:hypothetical protein